VNSSKIKYKFFLIIQYFLASFFFDLPGFKSFKIFIYKFFINIGKSSTIAHGSFLKCENCSNQSIIIGSNVEIAANVIIDFSGGIEISDNVWISEDALILTHTHISASRILKEKQRMKRQYLLIESDAWIGSKAIIYPRVKKIGRGAIIGAGSVVFEDVEDWQILVGNPAKVISRRIDPPKTTI